MIIAEMVILIAMMIAGTAIIVMLVIITQEYLNDRRIELINEKRKLLESIDKGNQEKF